MQIDLTFRPGIKTTVEVPEANLLFNAAPLKTGATPDQERIVRDSLANPIGAPRLDDLLRPDMQLVILVDDITRPTPTARILPHLSRLIEAAGIPDAQVRLITAPGTHRPLTDEEILAKIGREALSRFAILNRDYLDESKFVPSARPGSGIPIELDREVMEADFVIGLGEHHPPYLGRLERGRQRSSCPASAAGGPRT